MAILEILEAPDPRLKTVSKPVDTFDDQLKILVDDMFETMYAAHGIGLAAIQVGVPLRLLVIDLQPEDPDAEPEPCDHDHGDGHHHHHQPTKREPRIFVNPEILDPSAETKSYQEGCLSVPEMFADVLRPAEIQVKWLDENGKAHDEKIDGLLATCLQHEMDHLNGVLFIDHLSKLKRDMLLKKLEKLRRSSRAA